jgi:hypothetical protein
MSALISSTVLANAVSADFLKNEIEAAHTQYTSGSNESGLYALETLARLLESDKSSSLQLEVGINNLSFTYIRIGLLYEGSGNESKANSYFTRAVSIYKGEKIEVAQLKNTVKHLDNERS